MSDSDEEHIPNSANTFLGNTTVYSLRHNINSTCMPGLNIQNNMSTLMYNMHPNYRNHNFSLDQKSIYNRREMSPMSMRSVPDFRPHNMQYSYYRSEMGYQKSPSVRSMDTTASTTVSAADIAQAFKMAKFNKYDCRVIKDAYIKYMKSRARKRIEKRRNLKSFLKRNRRKSGEDSGEQGSDSSISSDDCKSTRSVRSTIPKENIFRPMNRSNRSEIIKFKNTMRESDMYKDCTENLRQNSLKTIFNDNTSKRSTNLETVQNTALGTQERLTKELQLPLQRFNNLNKVLTTRKETLPCNKSYGYRDTKNLIYKNSDSLRNPHISTDSENEEVFSRHTLAQNNITNSLQQKNNTVENSHHYVKTNLETLQNTALGTQKERFSKGFQLPLHRFNELNKVPTTRKETLPCDKGYGYRNEKHQIQKDSDSLRNPRISTDSENEEIFTSNTLAEYSITNSLQQKNNTVEDFHYSDKNNKLTLNTSLTMSDNQRGNDFLFKKPQVPFRKQANESLIREEIIASLQPLIGHVESNKGQKNQMQLFLNHKNSDPYNKNVDIIRFTESRESGIHKTQTNKSARDDERDSEKDEIFSNITVKEKSMTSNLSIQQKRALETEEVICSESKRSKKAPSKEKYNKVAIKSSEATTKNVDECKKLQEKPINNLKKNLDPKIVSKSKRKINKSMEQSNALRNNNETLIDNENETTSDVSMRPSFIKRKLFTQKLDVTENKNFSSDGLTKNSPCSKNYNPREKNKVRKLATSQSCLSRDVLENNNVLDLIHKIVPPDQMNLTNATNKKEIRKSNQEDEDKWDVTSVISMCKNNDVSDTYTDEEIFELNHKHDKPIEPPKQKSETMQMQCKVVVDKLHPEVMNNRAQNKNPFIEPQLRKKISVASCIRRFWDTDYDSDDAEVRNFSKDKLLKKMELKKNCEKTTTVKDALLTANSIKSNFISTIRKESSQIINGKSSTSSHITKQTNNKVLTQNSKLDDKGPTKKTSSRKKKKDLKADKQQKNSTNLQSQKPKENNKSQRQTSCLTDNDIILTRSLRLKNKENLNESQCSAGDRSILTRSLSLRMKEKFNDSQSCSGEKSILTRSMMVKNKKLNDSLSSAVDHNKITRSQQLKNNTILNESLFNNNECISTKNVKSSSNVNVKQQTAVKKTSPTQTIKSNRYNKTQVLKKPSSNRTRSKPISSR